MEYETIKNQSENWMENQIERSNMKIKNQIEYRMENQV